MLYFMGIKWVLIVHLLSKRNLGFLLLLLLVTRNLKRGEKEVKEEEEEEVTNLCSHVRPLRVMLEMSLQPLQVMLGAQV
jgi:hypothetical protein